MKVKKTMLMPIVLGLFVSACSTSSREETTSMVELAPSQDISQSQASVSDNNAINNINAVVKTNTVETNAFEEDLKKQLAAKVGQISRLNRQLEENSTQLTALNRALNEKDAIIADLQDKMARAETTSAEALAELEREKTLRESLEFRYASIQLQNDSLNRRVTQLESENALLQQQIAQLETMPASKDALEYKYQSLLREHTQLQNENAELDSDINLTQQSLRQLRNENLTLGGALSEARAQHQILWDKIRELNDRSASLSNQGPDVDPRNVAESSPTNLDQKTLNVSEQRPSIPQEQTQVQTQVAPVDDQVTGTQLGSTLVEPVVLPSPQVDQAKLELQNENDRIRRQLAQFQNTIDLQKRLIDEYKKDVLKLEAALDEGADYAARWQALDTKLALAQQTNTELRSKLNESESALLTYQAELAAITTQLAQTQRALEANENNSITMAAVMDALQSQLDARLVDVEWQLPNEMALHNTFEILVSARVEPALGGVMFQAELVTDSDIQMVSDSVVGSVVQGGRLQWRWRVSGLNEKPDAQLNLFVNQQINFQDQTIQRQVFRGNENLSLINTNLFEKYGFWLGAIFLGLVGGYLIGRVNRRLNTSPR